MTTQTMRNQVARIKTTLDGLKSKPAPKVKVLTKPSPDAGADAQVAFDKDLAAAQRYHDRVFIVTGQPERDRDREAKVQYFQNRWQASMAVLAGQPSEHGNKSALDDLLKSLPGTVLGSVANPPPDIYEVQT